MSRLQKGENAYMENKRSLDHEASFTSSAGTICNGDIDSEPRESATFKKALLSADGEIKDHNAHKRLFANITIVSLILLPPLVFSCYQIKQFLNSEIADRKEVLGLFISTASLLLTGYILVLSLQKPFCWYQLVRRRRLQKFKALRILRLKIGHYRRELADFYTEKSINEKYTAQDKYNDDKPEPKRSNDEAFDRCPATFNSPKLNLLLMINRTLSNNKAEAHAPINKKATHLEALNKGSHYDKHYQKFAHFCQLLEVEYEGERLEASKLNLLRYFMFVMCCVAPAAASLMLKQYTNSTVVAQSPTMTFPWVDSNANQSFEFLIVCFLVLAYMRLLSDFWDLEFNNDADAQSLANKNVGDSEDFLASDLESDIFASQFGNNFHKAMVYFSQTNKLDSFYSSASTIPNLTLGQQVLEVESRLLEGSRMIEERLSAKAEQLEKAHFELQNCFKRLNQKVHAKFTSLNSGNFPQTPKNVAFINERLSASEVGDKSGLWVTQHLFRKLADKVSRLDQEIETIKERIESTSTEIPEAYGEQENYLSVMKRSLLDLQNIKHQQFETLTETGNSVDIEDVFKHKQNWLVLKRVIMLLSLVISCLVSTPLYIATYIPIRALRFFGIFS